jgi:nucleotide-binding universal stress UspA family protein
MNTLKIAVDRPGTPRATWSEEARHPGDARTEPMAALPRGYRRVLVAVDRFDAPDVVVHHLLKRAPGAPLDVVVLQVLPEWTMQRLTALAEANLRDLTSRLSADAVRVAVDVRRGEPVTQILAAAHDHRVDLIAMTAHRRGLVDRLLDLSTLDAVLRESPIPVLVVHGPAGVADACAGA